MLLIVPNHFLVVLAFTLAGTLAQHAALARLPLIHMHDDFAGKRPAESDAALVCSTGCGVRRAPAVQALAGTALGLTALMTDPVFGAGVVYDVLAQRRLWASELTYLALACGAVVLVKFAVFRVY
jgi:hypothetical protein